MVGFAMSTRGALAATVSCSTSDFHMIFKPPPNYFRSIPPRRSAAPRGARKKSFRVPKYIISEEYVPRSCQGAIKLRHVCLFHKLRTFTFTNERLITKVVNIAIRGSALEDTSADCHYPRPNTQTLCTCAIPYPPILHPKTSSEIKAGPW